MTLLSHLLIFFFLSITYGKLVQVQVIHRHGARSVIDKHHFDPRIERENPALYPAGIKQLEKLGSYIRSQYIEPSAIKDIKNDLYLERKVFSRTSNFQRTQLSARAFLRGLYPVRHDQIPILVFNGTETDWIIRGYALCPKLAQRFKDFVSGDGEYKKKKEENEEFVIRLAQKLGFTGEDSSFENVFNVYDEYNIIYNRYDDEEDRGIEIEQNEMSKLEQLADWYESHKFAFATHKVHVASGLLAKILQHADSLKKPLTDSYRIVQFSAHYPTLLTLLASLRAHNGGGLEWPANEIPEFGAALIFEVHEEDDEELWVRMKWYAGGDQNEDAVDVAIGVNGCKDVTKKCKLSSMQRSLVFDTFQLEGFCRDCESTSGVCASVRRNDGKEGSTSSQMEGTEVCSIGTKAASGAIGVVLVVALGLGLWLLHYIYAGKKKRVERAVRHNSDTCGFEGEVYA